MPQPYTAIGLMSGTSLDGIDAALVSTDGTRIQNFGPTLSVPYSTGLRARLRAVLGGTGPVVQVEDEVTRAHAQAVTELLAHAHLSHVEIDVIGFHGHTILHRPAARRTWQIGDGALLAQLTAIDVVADFRSADVAAGGEGAPLAPLFHAVLAERLEKPIAFLNIGGIANLTWLGLAGEVIAFDTGPGNALLDDWMFARTGKPFDEGGMTAASGQPDQRTLATLLSASYFERVPPKSLDRLDLVADAVAGLETADGAATLAAFTCLAVKHALKHLPQPPRRWLVTGGGRKNLTMMAGLAHYLGVPVAPVEQEGWDGDAFEAQAFAFLAVRARLRLPLTLPTTTGVAMPMSGGRLFYAGFDA